MLFTEQRSHSHTYRLTEQILQNAFILDVSLSSESPLLPSVKKGKALHVQLVKV